MWGLCHQGDGGSCGGSSVVCCAGDCVSAVAFLGRVVLPVLMMADQEVGNRIIRY